MRSALRRHAPVIVAAALLAGAVAGVVMARTPTRYTAQSSFFVETRPTSSLPQSLAGLAGQFGMLQGLNAAQSPQFFASLAISRELLTRVLEGRYLRSQGDSVVLLDLIVPSGSASHAARLQRGKKRFQRRVSIAVEPRTGVLTLRVTLGDPVLAAEVANRMVDAVDQFNAQNRRSQARARRVFVSGRAADAADTLRTSETDLRTFYERNREWRNSPTLTFEEGRLQRQVSIAQDVYLTLRRELETARVDEVNDTPTLSVIDAAVPPTSKSGPHRLLNTLLATLFAAVVVGWGLSFVESALAAGRPVPPLVERLVRGLPGSSR